MKLDGNDTTRRKMNRDGSCLVQTVATRFLARDGIEAIWLLHLSATQAHSDGYADAAKLMLEIADTAERLWLMRVQPTFRFSDRVHGRLGKRKHTASATRRGAVRTRPRHQNKSGDREDEHSKAVRYQSRRSGGQ
jgi:hypothetical protein